MSRNFYCNLFILCIIPYLSANQNDISDTFRLHIIDVGYGECFLMESPLDIQILIDGGYPENAQKIISYLEKQKISKLDYLIVTHSHPDHAGALPVIADSFKIGQIWTNGEYYPKLTKIANKKNIPIISLKEGMNIPIHENFMIHVLNNWEKSLDPNEGSMALMIYVGSKKIFFAGDIGPLTQKRITSQSRDLDAHFLKLPQHGLYLSLAFLKRVQPSSAILCVGKNSYGAPNKDVIELLKENGIPLMRTDVSGTFTLDIE